MAIRDHPARPPAMQRLVLSYLGLRMDWYSHAGYASTKQLCEDADVEERTVKRATSWARKHGLLLQTRRGHRISNDRVAASEWLLVLPETQQVARDTLVFQQVTGDTLGKPRGLQGRPKGTAAHPHQESSTSSTTSARSARTSSSDALSALNGAESPLKSTPATPEQYQAGAAMARAALSKTTSTEEE